MNGIEWTPAHDAQCDDAIAWREGILRERIAAEIETFIVPAYGSTIGHWQNEAYHQAARVARGTTEAGA